MQFCLTTTRFLTQSDFVCSSQSDYLEDREGVSRKLYFSGDLRSEHEHSIVHLLCIVEVAAACGY